METEKKVDHDLPADHLTKWPPGKFVYVDLLRSGLSKEEAGRKAAKIQGIKYFGDR